LNGYSDEILVEAARRGDKSAYALLVKRHYRYVFALCLGIVGNVHDAEDLAQEAMLRGFLKLERIRRYERFDQWILRVAKNLCFDFLRRKKVAKEAESEQAFQPGRTADSNNDYLHQLIEKLPMEVRLPLVMYYFDNKSTTSIAEKLKISHSGVCQRIREARKLLHKFLTEGVHDE